MELQFKLKNLNFTDVAKLCHLASPGVLALFSLQMLPETSKICPHVQLVLLQIRFCFLEIFLGGLLQGLMRF